MSRSSFDEQWEENVYCQGQQLNRWPSEFVVTGAYRYLAGLGASDRELLALDLGCGAGNNSVFLAKCGFKVLGVDGSETALKSARTLADQEGCEIKFVRGDFLNDEIWNDQEYDLVIDRAALTHNTRSVIKRTVAKVAQALRPGGWFVSELFSRDHSDVQFGLDGDDGSYKSFSGGYFQNMSRTFFADRSDIDEIFSEHFDLAALYHQTLEEERSESKAAVWKVIGVVR